MSLFLFWFTRFPSPSIIPISYSSDKISRSCSLFLISSSFCKISYLSISISDFKTEFVFTTSFNWFCISSFMIFSSFIIAFLRSLWDFPFSTILTEEFIIKPETFLDSLNIFATFGSILMTRFFFSRKCSSLLSMMLLINESKPSWSRVFAV